MRRLSLLRRSRLAMSVAALACIVGVTAGVALAGESITTSGKGKPEVYEGNLSCCQVIVLGDKGKNEFQTIVNTGPVAKSGKYQVTFTTFDVLGPAVPGSTEVVQCLAVDPAVNTENVGGVAGNGATNSPEHPNMTGNGVYANAAGNGVIEVPNAGDHIELKCVAGGGGKQGTYVAAAQMTATKVGKLVKDAQP
jgi:hypothetical protein